MIERIVLLKVRDDLANAASRQEMAVYSGKVLRSIPGVVDAKVGVPADEAAAPPWAGVTLDCDSQALFVVADHCRSRQHFHTHFLRD